MEDKDMTDGDISPSSDETSHIDRESSESDKSANDLSSSSADVSISGVSVELSKEGQRAQRKSENSDYIQPQVKDAPDKEIPFGFTPYGTYINPNDTYENRKRAQNRHLALAVASLVLGFISISCCIFYGAGIVFALIGAGFSFVATFRGVNKVRVMGIIGIFLNMIGLLLNIWFIVTLAMSINWDQVTLANISSINEIDPSDREAVTEWARQFFKDTLIKSVYP